MSDEAKTLGADVAAEIERVLTAEASKNGSPLWKVIAGLVKNGFFREELEDMNIKDWEAEMKDSPNMKAYLAQAEE